MIRTTVIAASLAIAFTSAQAAQPLNVKVYNADGNGGFNPKCNRFNEWNRVAGSGGPDAQHRPQWACASPASSWDAH